jgi:predicted permease
MIGGPYTHAGLFATVVHREEMGEHMAPVNWVAVMLAAAVALATSIIWHGALFRAPRSRRAGAAASSRVGTAAVMLIGAAMLGHAYARIGPDSLAAKPWLYFMQSGGIALAFVMPAVWLTQAGHRAPLSRRVIDAGCWLTAYLAMGLVFWVLG